MTYLIEEYFPIHGQFYAGWRKVCEEEHEQTAWNIARAVARSKPTRITLNVRAVEEDANLSENCHPE